MTEVGSTFVVDQMVEHGWVRVRKFATAELAIAYAEAHGPRFKALEVNPGSHWLSRTIGKGY